VRFPVLCSKQPLEDVFPLGLIKGTKEWSLCTCRSTIVNFDSTNGRNQAHQGNSVTNNMVIQIAECLIIPFLPVESDTQKQSGRHNPMDRREISGGCEW